MSAARVRKATVAFQKLTKRIADAELALAKFKAAKEPLSFTNAIAGQDRRGVR